MHCCKNGLRIGVTSIFIFLNALVILFSILLVVYEIVTTVSNFADSWDTDISSVLNVSTSAVQTFMVVSTLLATFFSAIAAYGMEAANFRQHWEDELFTLCCCHLLKAKMMIYILITGIGSIAILTVTALFHTNVIFVDVENKLDAYILGSCNDIVADLVKPLQPSNQCCGIRMNSTSCGNWENNVPLECACSSEDQNDANLCVSASEAASQFGCSGVTDAFIYKNGCLTTIIDTYFTGFATIYAFGYILGGTLLFACVLAVIIYVKGEKGRY